MSNRYGPSSSSYGSGGHSAANANYDDGDDFVGFAAGGSAAKDRDFLRRNFTDFNSIHLSQSAKLSQLSHRDRKIIQPHYTSLKNITTPHANINNPAFGICSHYLRRGFTKPIRHQLHAGVWSADGRWLVLGAQSGDFYLWEGESLKVNKPVSQLAHKFSETNEKDMAITAMAWNNHGNSLASGDEKGNMQFCDESFRHSIIIREAHGAGISGLSFSPFDSRLASSSDDGLVRVWLVGEHKPELSLEGHGSDVRCVDWHPYRSLIASGSRDSGVKLWDPKSASCVSNITSHKKAVTCCKWNKNGNWLATGSRDQLLKVFDIRTMKELESFRGHNSDVTCLDWHPQHESLLLSGGYFGSLIYWIVGHNQCAHTAIADAHRQSIDVITWHPGGHLVATASHDGILKFWCQEPPGSKLDPPMSGEIVEIQGSSFGYGPLPPAPIPSVIQASAAAIAAANAMNTGGSAGGAGIAGVAGTSNTSGSGPGQGFNPGGRPYRPGGPSGFVPRGGAGGYPPRPPRGAPFGGGGSGGQYSYGGDSGGFRKRSREYD